MMSKPSGSWLKVTLLVSVLVLVPLIYNMLNQPRQSPPLPLSPNSRETGLALKKKSAEARPRDITGATPLPFEEPIQLGQPITAVDAAPANRPIASPLLPPAIQHPQRGPRRPQLAIIIDDMGHNKKLGEQLIHSPLNLTFSFLPHAPLTVSLAQQAFDAQRNILIHMPMEPIDPQWDPGPGALRVSQKEQQRQQLIVKNLAAVPHAIGVNNHMGSRFTSDQSAMRQTLAIIQQKGLFFVDSMTTPHSQGIRVAQQLGLAAVRRQIFLDNIQTPIYICGQLKKLVASSQKNGQAIGIGHPNHALKEALETCWPKLAPQVELVGVQQLVRAATIPNRPDHQVGN